MTTCDVSASLGALICQIHARRINFFVDNGTEVRVRCGGWRRQLRVKIQKKLKKWKPLTGGGLKTSMSSGRDESHKYRSVDTCITMMWLIN